jgi:hypothetical protein
LCQKCREERGKSVRVHQRQAEVFCAREWQEEKGYEKSASVQELQWGNANVQEQRAERKETATADRR